MDSTQTAQRASAIITLTSILTVVINLISQERPGSFSNSIYPPDKTETIQNSNDPVFDFIVVGGGSAGSVIASRLSENENWSVLLIEAGDYPSNISDIPIAVYEIIGTTESWDYILEPQEDGMCLGTNHKRCRWPKGKALGGSSVTNGMMYIVGNKQDFNDFASAGNTGWGSDDVLYYYKKSQEMEPDYIAKHGTKDFGDHGLLPLRHWNSSVSPQQDNVLEATASLGYPVLEAFTLDSQMGFGKLYGNMVHGRRVSASKAFLAPARDRENLFVVTKTLANKVILKDNVATGVEMTLANGETITVRSKKEVILSAGTIATPQLLMLSGIGPAEHLNKMGIKVIADLPVGKNLQDHLMWMGIPFSYAGNSTLSEVDQIAGDISQYVSNQEGAFAGFCGIDLTGFINVNDATLDVPDIQLIFGIIRKGDSAQVRSVINAFDWNSELSSQLLAQSDVYGTIMVAPVLLHPKSRGEVLLNSTNPRDPPKIYANYLSHPDDLDTLMKSLNFIKDLANTDAFLSRQIHQQYMQLSDCSDTEFDSRDYWECNLRHTGTTIWHPVGTAKMGPCNDSTAVVDPELRVHGFQNLRVADVSVLPGTPSGNTNAPAMMIGEKAADLVKATWAE